MTIADELRAAAEKLAPESDTVPTLTGEYPDLDACFAHLLRSTAETVDAVARHLGEHEVDESAHWLAPALTAARRINAG